MTSKFKIAPEEQDFFTWLKLAGWGESESGLFAFRSKQTTVHLRITGTEVSVEPALSSGFVRFVVPRTVLTSTWFRTLLAKQTT